MSKISVFMKKFFLPFFKIISLKSKFFRMISQKNIGTHSGRFHADEVLACCMLTKYTSLYHNAKITRTRSPEILEKQDILVDVGGIYDPTKNRFDHHQKEFQDFFDENHKIRLSSAGLIYKHFGREILRNLIQEHILKEVVNYNVKIELTESFIEEIFQKLYNIFIQTVDAIDNGVELYSKELFEGKTPDPNYVIMNCLESRVGKLNSYWTEKNSDEDAQFFKAIEVANEELISEVRYVIFSWWPARPIIQEAIDKRLEISKSGVIIKLEKSCPWKDHLFEIEKQNDLEGVIKFVLFPEKPEPSTYWRVIGINLKGSFALRRALREEWRGINDVAALAKISGIEDIVFCHASGFIGGAKSLESVIKMAELSLDS